MDKGENDLGSRARIFDKDTGEEVTPKDDVDSVQLRDQIAREDLERSKRKFPSGSAESTPPDPERRKFYAGTFKIPDIPKKESEE